MPPYGIALAADALGKAISGTFKGMSEGHEERRKEEESGRRARAAMAEEAYQPIRFKQGQLGLEQTEQSIRHAESQEGRAQAQETRTAQRHPLEQRLLTANVETAEVAANNAAAKAKLEMDESQARLNLTNQQLEEAKVKFPWLVPQLEEEQRNRNQEYVYKAKLLEKASFELSEATKARDAQNRISAKFLAAGRDRNKIIGVLSEPDARYLDPNDWLMRYQMGILEAESRATGQINPLAVHAQKELSRRAAIDDATKESKRMMQAIDRVKAESGGEGAPEMEGWLYKYSVSRYLRQVENTAAGVTYSDADKYIPPMPPVLIQALADSEWQGSGILNSEFGREYRLEVYTRMNEYLTQGADWAVAGARAKQDIERSKQGIPTASDHLADTIPKDKNWYEHLFSPEERKTFNKLFGGSKSPTPSIKPDIVLPPAVTGKGTKEEVTQKRLDDIVTAHPKLQGMTWNDLLAPGNEAWKNYIEEVYKEKYGSKP